jgi:glutamate carboxypeptidase
MMRAFVFGAALALMIGPAIAEPNKQILDRARHYQADALKLLERLVNIDSGTGYADGLVQVGAIAVEELRKLGADIEILPAKPADFNRLVTGLLHARLLTPM